MACTSCQLSKLWSGLDLLDQGSEDDSYKKRKWWGCLQEKPLPPSLLWPMQVFTWETREQRKPLKREASWRGGRHWWGERRGDSWERGGGGGRKGGKNRERDGLVYLVLISAEGESLLTVHFVTFSSQGFFFLLRRKIQQLIPQTGINTLLCRASKGCVVGLTVVVSRCIQRPW